MGDGILLCFWIEYGIGSMAFGALDGKGSDGDLLISLATGTVPLDSGEYGEGFLMGKGDFLGEDLGDFFCFGHGTEFSFLES